jgi:uncharacterized SAM-binding protein YcdF (DUF218 family)
MSAIVHVLFFSPLLPVLLIAAGVLLIARRRLKAAAWLLSLTAAAILLLSTGAARDLILRPLEGSAPPFPDPAPAVDAIVVLGGGLAPEARGSAAERLSASSLKRVIHAALLRRRLPVALIVCGGVTWRAPGGVAEADVAARALEELGVPGAAVIVEPRSRDTWENAQEAARIVRGLGGARSGRVALVTSAWHMPRALMSFARAGLSCVPAPTDYLAGSGPWTAADFLPSIAALEGSVTVLQELAGMALYAVRRPRPRG